MVVPSRRAFSSVVALALAVMSGGRAVVRDAGVSAEAAVRLSSSDFPVEELRAAARKWELGCAAAGVDLPALQLEGAGVPVTVRRRADSWSANGRCGQALLRLVDGRVVSAEIDVFVRQANGASCFPLVDVIAHELGHVLGLADEPPGPDASVMGPRQSGVRRHVAPRHCRTAAALAESGRWRMQVPVDAVRVAETPILAGGARPLPVRPPGAGTSPREP
jgi:hypothetical protein